MKLYHGSLQYGPVANDRVYAAFSLFEQGLLSKQELITELKTYKLVDQMLFHTENTTTNISPRLGKSRKNDRIYGM